MLKNQKITISWPQFKRFQRNLVRLCSSILLTTMNVKNIKFHISAAVSAISTKFGTLMHFDLIDLSDHKKLKFLKYNMAASAFLKNRKISISRPRFEQF